MLLHELISAALTQSDTCSCVAEVNTVKRDGTNLRFFSGDGVVKNVASGQAAVFEVCCRSCMFQMHLHSSLIS